MCEEFVCLKPSYLVLYFFVLYINHLYRITSEKSNPVLFASDTSIIINIIITDFNPFTFKHNINEVFREINKRFWDNILLLNYNKTYFLQFVTKENQHIDTQILLERNTLLISIVPNF